MDRAFCSYTPRDSNPEPTDVFVLLVSALLTEAEALLREGVAS